MHKIYVSTCSAFIKTLFLQKHILKNHFQKNHFQKNHIFLKEHPLSEADCSILYPDDVLKYQPE